jgi:hypothetical protein
LSRVTHDGSPDSGAQKAWAAPFYNRLRASGFTVSDITASAEVQAVLRTEIPGLTERDIYITFRVPASDERMPSVSRQEAGAGNKRT